MSKSKKKADKKKVEKAKKPKSKYQEKIKVNATFEELMEMASSKSSNTKK